MDYFLTENIKPYLEPDETLHWAGQPEKGIFFEFTDIFKTIAVVLLSVFTCFAITQLVKISWLLAVIVGVFFFSVCIFLGVVRFFIDAMLRKSTFYGLTNKRVIIKTGTSNIKVRSVYLNSKPKIDFLPHMDNNATIDIGLQPLSTLSKAGITWIPNAQASSSLYRLADGATVHKKIKEIIASL